MAEESYLTVAEFRAASEWPQVAAKTDAQLERVVYRAHTIGRCFGPFPLSTDLNAILTTFTFNAVNYTESTLFLRDMKEAHILISEGMIFAASALPAEAAGIVSETIGEYRYSRSQGESQGVPVQAADIPDAAADIFKKWRIGDDVEFNVIRTDVFEQTTWVDEADNDRKIPVLDNTEDQFRIAPDTGLGSI